jgi:hypothetical protein
MAYARLLLSSVDDATLSQGLTDACFVQLARAKLRFVSGFVCSIIPSKGSFSPQHDQVVLA